MTHFSHVFGKEGVLVTRRELLEEKVGFNEEDVLLDERGDQTADLIGRVGVFFLLVEDLVPKSMIVFRETDHLLRSFVKIYYLFNLSSVFV